MGTPEERMRYSIKSATDGDANIAVDWASFMAIVDMLNANPYLYGSEERASYSVRCERAAAMLKKQISNSNVETSLYAVHLLETIMNNCPRFHQHANHADFLNTVTNELQHKKRNRKSFTNLFRSSSQSNPRVTLEKQEKILILIQSWGKAFATSTTCPNFRRVYQQLQSQGIRFPEPTKDEGAPVFTPAAKPSAQEPQWTPASRNGSPVDISYQDQACMATHDNCTLLTETLNASDPDEDLRHNDLVQHLLASIKDSQRSIMTRVGVGTAGPSLTAELLEVNDEIIQCLDFYKGLVNGTAQRAVPAPAASAASPDSPADSEEHSDEPESPKDVADGTDDLLGLFTPVDTPASAPVEAPTATKAKKKKKKHSPRRRQKSGEAVPKLSPPPVKSIATRRSSGDKKIPTAQTDMIFDLQSPSTNPEPKQQDDDFDDFLNIAMRGDAQPSQQESKKQSTNPFDELFN